MMSDILLERSRPPQDFSCDLVKERIETIIDTLMMEKKQFQKTYTLRIAHYESEIREKDDIIRDLTQKLQASRTLCEKVTREADVYKSIVHELKQEFHRMETVIRPNYLNKEAKQLKRVKSDYLSNREDKSCRNLLNHGFVVKKIDINTCFEDSRNNICGVAQSIPQLVKFESKMLEQTLSNASKTVKLSNFPINKGQRDSGRTLGKTIQKWTDRKNWDSLRNKNENHVKIRDYKENNWEHTF